MFQLKKYLNSMCIPRNRFHSVFASGEETKIPKYSLTLNYTPNDTVAFCFPSRAYGIYQAFEYPNGSAVLISIFEPLFLSSYFADKLDATIEKYIWRATDKTSLSDALAFIRAPNIPPSVLFISLSNLFFDTPPALDSGSLSKPISAETQIEIYKQYGFRFVRLVAPPTQVKSAKSGPVTVSYEPGQVRDSFTQQDRSRTLQDLFRLFGVSLGPKFLGRTYFLQSDLTPKMNCFKDPRAWLLTGPKELPTLQTHSNTVVNVDYYGSDRKSYHSVYHDDIDRYTGFGPIHNERTIACPTKHFANWLAEYTETSSFFGLFSKLVKPIRATFALPPHSTDLSWTPNPQRIAWKDAVKILSIYNWMSVLASDIHLKKLVSQRLGTDYNQAMFHEILLLKLLQYKHGNDQISFVDFHLQEVRPLLDAFSDDTIGLLAWPFLLAKLWPGVESRLTLQVYLCTLFLFIFLCIFSFLKKSFTQRILGCQTLDIQLVPISKLAHLEQESVELSIWWVDDTDTTRPYTIFNIQSHLLFYSDTKPHSIFVKCLDQHDREMAFDLGNFLRTHSVYCTLGPDLAVDKTCEARQASLKPFKLVCGKPTLVDYAVLQLQMSDKDNKKSLSSSVELFRAHYSRELFENIIADVLYQCGGLRLLSKSNKSALDNSKTSVVCISHIPAQPNHIFTDDITPRSTEIDCPIKNKTDSKLDTSHVGMQFNADCNCVYDFVLSRAATVNVYIVPKKNLNAPISLELDGIECTHQIKTGPSNSFAIFCETDKTVILDFIGTETMGTINVRRFIRPYTSIVSGEDILY